MLDLGHCWQIATTQLMAKCSVPRTTLYHPILHHLDLSQNRVITPKFHCFIIPFSPKKAPTSDLKQGQQLELGGSISSEVWSGTVFCRTTRSKPDPNQILWPQKWFSSMALQIWFISVWSCLKIGYSLFQRASFKASRSTFFHGHGLFPLGASPIESQAPTS